MHMGEIRNKALGGCANPRPTRTHHPLAVAGAMGRPGRGTRLRLRAFNTKPGPCPESGGLAFIAAHAPRSIDITCLLHMRPALASMPMGLFVVTCSEQRFRLIRGNFRNCVLICQKLLCGAEFLQASVMFYRQSGIQLV